MNRCIALRSSQEPIYLDFILVIVQHISNFFKLFRTILDGLIKYLHTAERQDVVCR